MTHDWHFGSTTANDGPLITAICKRCGLMRRATVSSRDKHLDLRGDCPGEFQEPAKRAPLAG